MKVIEIIVKLVKLTYIFEIEFLRFFAKYVKFYFLQEVLVDFFKK